MTSACGRSPPPGGGAVDAAADACRESDDAAVSVAAAAAGAPSKNTGAWWWGPPRRDRFEIAAGARDLVRFTRALESHRIGLRLARLDQPQVGAPDGLRVGARIDPQLLPRVRQRHRGNVLNLAAAVQSPRQRGRLCYGTPATPWIVELLIVMLFVFVPTAVPALVTLPLCTFVQWPPVLPVIVVSAMDRLPP